MIPTRNRSEERCGDESSETDDIRDPSDMATSTAMTLPQHEAIPSASSTASSLIIAASDKAGMRGIDRGKIDAIILRESGNSAYMQQQRKRDQAVNQKIELLRLKLEEQREKDPSWHVRVERELQAEIVALLSSRSLHSTCVVVDLDMFYVNCELLTRPHLREVPAVVGGSMILTSNYCARQYGVRSAMAGWIGDKLVEELSGGKQKLVHIPSNFPLYTEKSLVVRRVLSEYDPNLRAYSLDEAYMNLGPYMIRKLQHPTLTHVEIRASMQQSIDSGAMEGTRQDDTQSEDRQDDGEDDADPFSISQHHDVDLVLSSFSPHAVLDAASEILSQMRQHVQQATGGLTCSAGLAPNFMLAKIASDYNKPDGQKLVGPAHQDVLSFVHPLPTRKIPGIGRVTEKQLQAFGISTVRDLYSHRALVRFLFQPATTRFLLRASLGMSSPSDSSSSSGQKGISRERTFVSGRPWSDVMSRLEDIARLLSSDMIRKDIKAHTLTVKVKLHSFDVLSKSRSLQRGLYLQSAQDMISLATELLGDIRKQHLSNTKSRSFSIRLLGMRCSNFQSDEDKDIAKMSIQRFLTADGDKKSNASLKRARSPTPPLSSSSRHDLSPIVQTRRRSPMASPDFGPAPSRKNVSPTPRENTLNKASVRDAPSTPSPPPPPVPVLQDCPMCQHAIPLEAAVDYNTSVNRHVDGCLNASVVREAVREESRAATERDHKQRLTDYFRPSRNCKT